MATEKLYSGDGSDKTFDITFPYLTHADIKVFLKEVKSEATEPYDANDYHYVNKSDPGDYSISGNTVTFTTAPADGTTGGDNNLLKNNIKITRDTVITSPEHEYSAGSSITATKLNENQKQALYAIQEAGEITATPGGISTGDKGPIFVENDASWVINDNSIANTHLQDNSVDTNEIKTNAVTADEIATNAVGADELANNAVDTNAIQDDAVTYPKLQNIATANRVLGRASAGEVQEVQVATDMIGDLQVTKAKIANSAITEARLEVSNTPTNGYVLTAQSGNTGGLTWSPAPTIGGSILETVSYVCDGESFTQRGTTYNTTEVKDPFDLSTTPTTVTGSQVTYTPPANTKTVIYEFNFMDARLANAGNGALWHGSLWLADGSNTPVEVFYSRLTKYSNGGGDAVAMKWAFPIGGTANTNYGRVASWTSAKTILMKVREYNNTNYAGKFHQTTYWNGQTEFEIHVPMITITAIS